MRIVGWQEHERYVQQTLGLSSTPGSGNQFNDVGDAVDRTHSLTALFPILADCKFTQNASMSVRLKTLQTLDLAAVSRGKHPILPIRFHQRADFTGPHDYVIMPLKDLADLLELAREKRC